MKWQMIERRKKYNFFFIYGDGIWDCPKGRVMGRRIILKHTILGKIRNNYKYFVVENHKLCF